MDVTPELRARVVELVAGVGGSARAVAHVRGLAKWPGGELWYGDDFLVMTATGVTVVRAKETGTFKTRIELSVGESYPFGEMRNVGVQRDTQALCFEHDPQELWFMPMPPASEWDALMGMIADGTDPQPARTVLSPERSLALTTWTQVQEYVTSTFVVDRSEPGMMRITFDLGNGRSQLVFLRLEVLMDGMEEWLVIESPIGRLGEVDLDRALAAVGEMVSGALTVRGDVLMLKHSAPIAGLDSLSLERPLRLIVSTADRLESELVGGDTF